MKCLQDIKFDIIDKIREDLVKGGLFSYGPTRDTVIAKSEENIKGTIDALNSMYREGLVSSEGKRVAINPSTELAQKYLDRFNQVKESVPFSYEQEQRVQNIDNTGPNTAGFYEDLAPAAMQVGVFEQFINHKKSLQSLLQERMNKILQELKDTKTTVARRTELNNLKQKIKTRLEGDINKGIKGIQDEINDLKKISNVAAIGYYVEQDLARLAALTSSNNPIDLKEAKAIIDFYDRAGTFQSDRENPFFPQGEMFFFTPEGKQLPDYQLGQDTMDQFVEWRNIAMGFAPAVDLKEKEVTVNQFNSSPGVKKIYGNKEFSFDEIVHTTEGLKDVDWVSAWAMDVTQSIFSKSAMLAQVMHSTLTSAMEKHLNFSRDYAKRMEELAPEVAKRLGEIDGGKYKLKAFGILGLSGISYELFMDATKNGMQTGTLVQRFSKEYTDKQLEEANKFSDEYEKARLADPALQAAMYNSAYEKQKAWRRANNFIMNPHLVQEISTEAEFAAFKGTATQAEMDAHKAELVAVLGTKGYNDEVEKQKNLLRKFMADKQSYIDAQVTAEGVADEAALSAKSKFVLNMWDHRHNPMTGIEDYYSVKGVYRDKKKINNYMDYNNLIPRNNKVAAIDVKGQYTFQNTSDKTGWYNEKFKTIEADPLLQRFHSLVKEGLEKIIDSAPYELQRSMGANTLPMLMKSTAEFLIDNKNDRAKMVSSAFRRMWEQIRLSFGLIQQSEVSYAVKDPITGKYNYKVNDSFLEGNKRVVQERSTIEKVKFLQAYNIGRAKNARLTQIKRFTRIPIAQMNPQALAHLAQLLNVNITLGEIQAGKIQKIQALTGDMVDVGRIIRDFSVHTAVQAQSFDLPRLMKHFTNLAAAYAARTETLPMMEIMKKHYEEIKNPKTTNTGKSIFNVLEKQVASEGPRKKAIDQMEDWFQRVMLDNYGIKHWGVFGTKTKTVDEVDDQGNKTGKIKTKVALLGETIYSKEDRAKIDEIDALINQGVSAEEAESLNTIKKGLGKTRTASAAIINFLDMLRTLRLGYNLASSVTNFAEGYTSNMILAASGDFFEPNEIYYGYHVAKLSWVKNLTFGKRAHPEALKARMLMDRYNVLLDSKNELQKAAVKSNLSHIKEALNPYELNARVEYINQMPLMVAMLRSTHITGKDGTKSSVWDAMDKYGNLTDNFNTDENVENWEKLTKEDYIAFKDKLNEAIVRGHGNYDELRGMMLKSSLGGKAIAMFKTWLPMQLYWRFAQEQENLKSGQKFKGRYRSFTPGSAGVFAAGLGLTAFGPLGLVAAFGGIGAAHLFGVKTEIGAIKELAISTKLLAKKALGMPVNILSRSFLKKNLIDSSKDFDNWIGYGGFTEIDAKNLRGNMAELAVTMATLVMMLLVKSFFWDDDDDKEDIERQFHNIAVNKLMQLSSQASMYVNPSAIWKSTVGDIAIYKFLDDCGVEMTKLGELLRGADPGGNKTLRQTRKMFLPGIFKDFKGGFGTQAEKQFNPSPFDDWFHGEEFLTARREKQERHNRGEELKEMGYSDKQKLKILNVEMPTSKQLNKKGYTREEWDAEHQDFELPEIEKEEEEAQ